MYLWRTLCFLQQCDRVLAPRLPQIRFDLLLSRSRPRRIVTLCHANALMAEQDRHALKRNAGEKQFNRERVAESMRMALGNSCERKEPL